MSRSEGFLRVRWLAKRSRSRRLSRYPAIVLGLAFFWLASLSVKKDCRVGASALIGGSLGGSAGGRRRVPSALGRRTSTSYSDVGITGITPIPGLFRYPLPCPR